MTFLEAIIVKLTRETSIGDTCRVGDASITVHFSAGIWEWGYGGRTFCDVHVLALAIIQDSKASPIKPISSPKKIRALRDSLKDTSSPIECFLVPAEDPWGQAL